MCGVSLKYPCKEYSEVVYVPHPKWMKFYSATMYTTVLCAQLSYNATIPCVTNIWTTRGARVDTQFINNSWGFIKHFLTFWWSRKVTKQVVNKSMRSYKHVHTTLLVIIIISTSTLYNKFTVITYVPVCTCCCLFFHKVRSNENKIHNQQE